MLAIEWEIAHTENTDHNRKYKEWYNEQARQAVRNFFTLNYNHKDYNVNIWRRISDVIPGLPTKHDTDLPLIDRIANQHGTAWHPISS